jgi:hypothetical protein
MSIIINMIMEMCKAMVMDIMISIRLIIISNSNNIHKLIVLDLILTFEQDDNIHIYI